MVGCSIKGVHIMRFFRVTMTGFMCIGMTALALANPAMLPKHPGYPSSGEYANDTGQPNLTYKQSILESSKSGDTNLAPGLIDPNNGRLPIVDGVTNKIELPAKEPSRMPTKK